MGTEQGVYGKRIVERVAGDLTAAYGRGFSEKSLRNMIRFAEAYEDETIVSTLSRQLSWSHFLDLIYIDDSLKRDFYAEMCRLERWSVRTLRAKLDGMLYKRTALLKETGGVDAKGTCGTPCRRQDDSGPCVPRSLPARFFRTFRYLERLSISYPSK